MKTLLEPKTIMVLRHAKSDWGAGLPDYERPLNARGQRGARQMGAVLATYDIDLVWCSGARRTVETWELAQEGGAKAKQLDERRGFYQSDPDDLMEEMRLLDETVASLLIINHQPTVAWLVVDLVQPSDLAVRVAEHYPTAGLAVMTYDGTWADLSQQSAVLRRFESPS